MDKVSQQEFWSKVPHWVVLHPALDAFAIKVYCVLSMHANNTTRQAFPGTRVIAKEGHMARNTVFRALVDLEAVGALVITKERDGRHRKVNHYFLPMFRGGSPGAPPPSEVVHAMNHGGSSGDTRGGSSGEPELDPSELEEITRSILPVENPKPRLPGESRAVYARRLAEDT